MLNKPDQGSHSSAFEPLEQINDGQIEGGIWLKMFVGGVVFFIVAALTLVKGYFRVVKNDSPINYGIVVGVLLAATLLGAALGALLGIRDSAKKKQQLGLPVSWGIQKLFLDGWILFLGIPVVMIMAFIITLCTL